MRKKGRPECEKVEFSENRLYEVLEYRNLSLRKLDKDPACDISEKTIRRSAKSGKINPLILEKLANYLGVDPLFLRGYYRSDIRIALLVNERKQR